MTRKMKDSGIEWIGEIPEDWGTSRLKNFIKSRKSGVWGKDEDPENYEDNIVCIRIADFDYPKMTIRKDREFTLRNYTKSEIAKYTLHKGDILVEKSGGGEKTPVGRTIVWNEDFKALYANFIERLRLDENLVMPMFAQFCFYAFYGMGGSNLYFNQTTGLQNLDMSKMLNSLNFPVPEILEQISIINLLNKKTKQIEEMKTTIINEIQTLEDYKKSVITESVTKGLDENVEMKDSGIEWIGEIPKHWEIDRVKYHFKIISGSGFPIEKQGKEAGDYPVCKASDIANANVILNSAANYLDKNQIAGYNIVPKNSIIMPKIGEAMKKNNRAIVECDVLIDNNCQGLFPIFVDFKFAYYLFKIIDMNWFDNSGTIPSINNTRLVNSSMPYPPKKEQEQIVAYLDEKTTRIDEAIAAKKKQLEIIEEYKKSLIYEYVTGKKEVEDVGTI